MRLYITRPRSGIKAVAEYNRINKTFIVLKDSIISENISLSEKFRGSKSITKYRVEATKGTRVIQDILFKSASTAANFVTGTSTNGLIAWKDQNGKTLKTLLEEMEAKNE